MSEAQGSSDSRLSSFKEFYPFYLGEHKNLFNRRLHFFGTSMVITGALAALITQNVWLLLALPIAGYAPAWIGHFIVEKNRPATFKYPLWSLLGDFKMFWMGLKGEL